MRRHLIVLTVAAALAACGGKKADTTPVSNGSDAAGTGTGEGTATQPTDPAQTPPAGGTGYGRPASVTDEMIAVMDKVVGAFEALGRDLEAVGTDCAKGAAAMRSHTPKLKALAVEAKKFDEQTRNDQAAEEYFQKTYGDRLVASMGGLMQLSSSCASDPDFQAASDEFGKALE